MAPPADSDDEAAFLDSAQDAGVLVENLHRACPWFLCAKSRLAPAKNLEGCAAIMNTVET